VGKTLIIAEKPSVARDLAAVLGKFNNRDGHLENGRYIVSWAFGHLLELAEPEDYDAVLKRWDLAALPIMPASFQLKPIASGRKQLGVLKGLLRSNQVDEVVNACDAGREGEIIFRRIYETAGCTKPFRRLWLSEATPAAVKAAFRKLRPGRELDSLAAAAEARSRADWLVGINATRAWTCRHGALLSVGRVQTPTLALVVQRDREIRNFRPEPYWQVVAHFSDTTQSYDGLWTRDDRDRFTALEQAERIQRALAGVTTARVTKVGQKDKQEPPPQLYYLTALQRDANRRYGLTAKATLDAAQALYEKHKLFTYPRTDSRYLMASLAGTLAGRIDAVTGVPDYAGFRPPTTTLTDKRFVDDSKVTDHHAIIPTATTPDLGALSKPERQVYDLVARRFLAPFFFQHCYTQVTVLTEAAGEPFVSRGRVEIDPGWRVLYNRDEDEEAEPALPLLAEGQTVNLEGVDVLEKTTKPPKRYTEASLLAAMENAGRFLEDTESAGTLKAAGGIGTPATRAAIIETLIKRDYMRREKKSLIPTAKGEGLIDLVPEALRSVELTVRWENGLLDIERGGVDAAEWMERIKNYTREVVQLAREQESVGERVQTHGEALGQCPLCGREVIEYPKSYGCSGYRDGCKFAIWKEVAGKKITAKQARDLLAKGRTGVIRGFKSKAGKTFDAILVLGQDGKVGFEPPDRTAGCAEGNRWRVWSRRNLRDGLKMTVETSSPPSSPERVFSSYSLKDSCNDRYRFCPSAIAQGPEGAIRVTGDDALLDRRYDATPGPRIDFQRVLEGQFPLRWVQIRCPEHHGGHLLPGDKVIGVEVTGIVAFNNAVGGRRGNVALGPSALGVGKNGAGLGCKLERFQEHRHELGPGDVVFGAERPVGIARDGPERDQS